MLVKVSRVLLAVFVAIGCAQVSIPTALAEGICSPEAHSGSQYKTIGAQLSSCDKTQSAGTQSCMVRNGTESYAKLLNRAKATLAVPLSGTIPGESPRPGDTTPAGSAKRAVPA